MVEFGFCLEGSGIFAVDDKILPFHTGDTIVITPREWHLAKSSPGTVSRWIWVYFDPEKLLTPTFHHRALSSTDKLCGPDFNNIFSPYSDPEICRYIQDIITAFQGKAAFYQAKIRALSCLLMADLQEVGMAGETAKLSSFDPETMFRIQNALAYMTRHYAEAIPIRELAKRSNFSENHFRRLFTQAMGKSPLVYLNRLRVSMACAELQSSQKSIARIALDCGFPGLSNFNRQFKSQTGTTPREWRREQAVLRRGRQ